MELVQERRVLGEQRPFRTIYSALAYLTYNNPARSKSLNLLEPEGQTKPVGKAFSGANPADIWASLALGLAHILRQYDRKVGFAFCLCYLDPERKWHKQDAAKHTGLPYHIIRKRCRDIVEDLEREFYRRELIDAPPHWDYEAAGAVQ